ncbi:MAG: hypothetical protein JSS12_11910, partial [Verrucomicrobia bacterium]|nr:hypothetical protein [Verrucomicrobiota bacterium]
MFEKLKSIRMALCLLALSFLVLCGFVTTRDEKYVSYFLHLYSAGLFREQNFTLHDAKAVFGKDHIHRIEMQLSCYKAMPLESARKLVTNVAVDFLDKINNDPGLKEKGLIKEKFIPRQLYFRIMCDNVVGENYETIYIREIILDKGQLTYITFKNMPEFWGKSYTIHEDFDYALMLVGNTRHPEDVIAETVIVPELRALPGDTSDFPTRQHEELLYTGRQVTQAELEPRESAPSPISPLVIPVEAISQLNLPPQKVEIKEVVTPIEQEKAPPVPPVATQSQAPVVPSEPAVVPQPLLPTAQAPTAPQVIEKSVAPTQEVVVPAAPVPTAPIPAAPVPVAPVATLPASTAPAASAAIVAPTAPTAAVLPTA